MRGCTQTERRKTDTRLGSGAVVVGKKKATGSVDVEQLAKKHEKRPVSLTGKDRAALKKIEEGVTPIHEAITELVSLVKARKLSPEDAILRVDARAVSRMHLPQFAEEPKDGPIGTGIGVSNGCASGIAVFDAKRAAELAAKGESVILIVDEILPDEVDEMSKVAGVICTMGDYGSHTSVLARDYGIAAVNGDTFDVDKGAKTVDIDGETIKEGDEISLRVDGLETGQVFKGKQEIVTHSEQESFGELMSWCAAYKGIDVKANADLPGAVARAFGFGASGVGLVRTEHMFFGDRRKTLQAAILALGDEEYRQKLGELSAFQKTDFRGIFEAAGGAPVSIRLMDPPLHELLPRPDPEKTRLTVDTIAVRLGMEPAEVEKKFRENPLFDRWVTVDFDRLFMTAEQESAEMMALSEEMDLPAEMIHSFMAELVEANPMMGLRGVRLSVAKPEIYEMQVRAMFEAAAEQVKDGKPVDLKIIVPLVNKPEEVEWVKGIVDRVKSEVEKKSKQKLDHDLVVMVETPAAALRAHELADACDGFSFGTNDLTQFTLALSRGDAAPVLEAYRENGLGDSDPFHTIDPKSVGKLIQVAVFFARHCGGAERPDFPAGICGEQGAEPSTIENARAWGIDYVSVSPYRVATALVASAQENIKSEADGGKKNGFVATNLIGLLAQERG